MKLSKIVISMSTLMLTVFFVLGTENSYAVPTTPPGQSNKPILTKSGKKAALKRMQAVLDCSTVPVFGTCAALPCNGEQCELAAQLCVSQTGGTCSWQAPPREEVEKFVIDMPLNPLRCGIDIRVAM